MLILLSHQTKSHFAMLASQFLKIAVYIWEVDSSRCFTQTLHSGLGLGDQPQEASPRSSPQHINYEQVLSTGKELAQQLKCTLPKLQVCALRLMPAQKIQSGCNQGYFRLLLIPKGCRKMFYTCHCAVYLPTTCTLHGILMLYASGTNMYSPSSSTAETGITNLWIL